MINNNKNSDFYAFDMLTQHYDNTTSQMEKIIIKRWQMNGMKCEVCGCDAPEPIISDEINLALCDRDAARNMDTIARICVDQIDIAFLRNATPYGKNIYKN